MKLSGVGLVLGLLAACHLPLATSVLAQSDEAPELTVAASQAIDKGLAFLLAHQNPDGSWGPEGRTTSSTALGLMAFMARGEFPGAGSNGDALTRAKDWLLQQAQESKSGYLGTSMYEHGLATLALTELWGMTGQREDHPVFQKAIDAAVDVILRSQNPAGGWRYQPTPTDADTSATVMVFIGLASARQAGVPIPNETINKVQQYLRSAENTKSGGFVYVPTGSGQAAGVSVACTAGGAYVAQLVGERDSDMVERALRYLEDRAPAVFEGSGYYYYAHYYAIQAMVQAGDERYAKWYPQIRDALIGRQGDDGSWPGKGAHATPMAIIILATPHCYIPIYQR